MITGIHHYALLIIFYEYLNSINLSSKNITKNEIHLKYDYKYTLLCTAYHFMNT